MLLLTLIPVFCVAAGGAIGSLLRYGAIQLVSYWNPTVFPLGTVLVNIAGSFAIGLLMARYLHAPSESAPLFFVTGILGGFTTFSAFSWDALQLMQRGTFSLALIYAGGSIICSFAAVAGGYQLGR